MVDGSWTACRAFCAVLPSSAVPGFWAVESSSETYLSLYLPTLPPDWEKASFSPLMTASDCSFDVPWSGSEE